MTNADKYLKDGVDIEELTNKFEDWHKTHSNVVSYGEALFRFLQVEVKPILSEGEKVILKNAHSPNGTIAYYVGRNEDTKNLFMRTKYDTYQYDWGCFDALFQFIQPRRRI